MRSETPDIVRVLRIAGWMWLGYLLALVLIDALMVERISPEMLTQYYLGNAATAAVFLGLSHWAWLQRKLGRAYVPLMVVFIAVVPVLAGRLFMPPLPPGPMSNIEGIALRMQPILFIALVITAWAYPWPYVVAFALGIALLEIGFVLVFPPQQPSAAHAVIFIAVVRTVSFLVVGYFISRLMRQLQAQQDALAQANARLAHYASTLENLTISRERNRMSRELHDTVVHTLSGLAVQLETTRAYLDVDPETARGLLDRALSATRTGLQETRRALKALRATPLEDLGLVLALRRLAESAAERGKLDLDLSLPEQELLLSPDVEQCIYRIGQEAVENVVHHANARRLTLHLEVDDEEIALEVRDDGIGFSRGARPASGHFGLEGMQERAQLAGGMLTIHSQPGQGASVQLAIRGR